MSVSSDMGGKDPSPDEPPFKREGGLETAFNPGQLLEQRIQELEAHNRELEALHQFNERLRGPVESKALIKRAVILIIETFQADSGTLFLRDKDNLQELVFSFGVCTLTKLPPPGTRIKVGTGMTGQVCQIGHGIRIADITELLQQNANPTLDPKPAWRSAMFIPLTDSQQRITGAMNLLAARPDYFSEEQLRLAERLAGQVGIALEQVEQLELRKERDQLAAVMALARTAAHELNQYLTILQANLDLVTEFNQPLDRETLEGMQQAITEITNRVRYYQKIEHFQIVEPVPGIAMLDYKTDSPEKS